MYTTILKHRSIAVLNIVPHLSGKLLDYLRRLRRFLKTGKALLQFIVLATVFNFWFLPDCSAQNSGKEYRWLGSLQIGTAQHRIKDKTFSSLSYSGWSPGGTASLKSSSSNSYHRVEIYYTTANLSTKGGDFSTMRANYGNVDYVGLYLLGDSKDESLTLMAGAGINILYNKRHYEGYINNNRTSEFITSVSAAIEGGYHFANGLHGIRVTNLVQVPLLSAAKQPVFGSDAFVVPGEGNSEKSMDILFVPSFLRFKNQITVSKDITHSQILSVIYETDYYKIRHKREVTQLNHRFGLSYGYKF